MDTMRRTTGALQSSHPPHAAVAPKRRRSIVYVWDSEYPWDVRTEKVCLALSEAGHSVRITARNRKGRAASEELPEGRVVRMPRIDSLPKAIDDALGFPAFFNPRWVRLIEQAVVEGAADMIMVRDLPLCPTAVHVGRRFGIPVVLDMAEDYPALMRALWETGRHRPIDYFVRNPRATSWVERYCLRRVDHVITVVEESADRLRAMGISGNKLSVVSNTPSKSWAVPARQSRTSADVLEVVYIGNVEVVRGLGEAIEATAILRSRGFRARLTVIGDGRDKPLFEAQARRLDLGPDAVDFRGFVEREVALRLVQTMDVGVIPHHKSDAWETTIPNKLFDYMAAGIPTVSSNTAPCSRILRETGAGATFVSGQAESLAGAIMALDPATAKRLGDAGRQAVLGRYNWEHDTAVLLKLLDRPELWGRRTAVRVLP